MMKWTKGNQFFGVDYKVSNDDRFLIVKDDKEYQLYEIRYIDAKVNAFPSFNDILENSIYHGKFGKLATAKDWATEL
jgi:hypothetical protein